MKKTKRRPTKTAPVNLKAERESRHSAEFRRSVKDVSTDELVRISADKSAALGRILSEIDDTAAKLADLRAREAAIKREQDVLLDLERSRRD
jgi:hypothetical protein